MTAPSITGQPRPAPQTLLLSDLVRSTDLAARLGDQDAARVEQRHDRLARDLLAAQRGREIDKTDGFLLLFDRPIDALRYAVSYHDALARLGEELAGERLEVELVARVGIHHGEVVEWQNPEDDVARGAKPVEIAGIAKQTAARVMALAGGRQTLLTSAAFEIARRGAVGQPEAEALSWRAHGRYQLQGLDEPVEVFEAGRPGVAPLVPPVGSAKAKRLDQPHDERSRRLARQLAEARARRDVLRRAKKSTAEIDAEIVRLHRRLRRGGHLNPGDTLCDGRFQVVEKVGEGGYAVVWKAWDAKRLEHVALKVLHGQHVLDLSRRERFFRGSRLMGELLHGVVEVVERQLEDGGFHFYAMELLAGGDFERACRDGRLTLDERLRVITQVADALDQAHARAVIHRDVKPSNILLGADGAPRLTDFDLVLAGDTTGGTRTQGMLGTFLYMAPEVMINAQEACPASDVFSLGMTAIFAVYGDDLPPAVIRDGDAFVARLHAPEALRAVLRKAIAWELEERFSTMAELGAALRRAMATGASPELPAEAVLRIEAGMHGAMINRIDVDAAGRFLVTGSNDKTARVWDLQRGELLRVLRPPIGEGDEGKVYAVALTPDGEVVAAGGWLKGQDRQHGIYLFERRSGCLLRRIAGLPNVVNHLVFSPDGLRLAAMLWGANGLRVFGVTDGEELYRDTDYGASSYGASFDAAGRLVTSCYDGRLRLYAGDHERLAMAPAPGGARPYAVAFSPEGGRIAVGYADSTRVDVVSGEDLGLLYSADTEGTNRNLGIVAFSDDGGFLFAAGRSEVDGSSPIRRWDDAGRGAFRDLPGPLNTVIDLHALPGARLVYGAQDPAWGVLEGDRTLVERGSAMADPRDLDEGFRIDATGTRVRFAFEQFGKRPALFSLAERRLEEGEAALAASSTLEGPRTTAPEGTDPGVEVTGWKNTFEPRLNGKLLPLQQHENSRSLALAADASGFLLGASWTLRFFTRDGEERWQKPVPGIPWSVQLTPDGRLALAAYGDGTIRWHRAADGEELLAFFPHRDGRRWVVWTPSGYWDASPGGETLIGWHVNRGDDREAVFHPAWRFGKKRHRPEVIDRILLTLDEAEAVRQADAAR